jgi:hypothetical protein
MSKVKSYLLISCAALTGCGVVHQAQLNSASQRAQMEIGQKCSLFMSAPEKEAVAWINSKDAMKECGGLGTDPWLREETMQISECGERVMNERIRPVVHSGQKFDDFMKHRKQEHTQYAEGEISWERMNELSAERLMNYFQSARTGSYFSYANCHNAILDKEVMPAYSAQLRPLLVEYASNVSAFSRQADKEHMAPEDYQIGIQKLWADFVSKEQGTINQYNAQNAQAWQKSMQNASQQIQQMEAETQRNAPKMSTANCTKTGNMVNCTGTEF